MAQNNLINNILDNAHVDYADYLNQEQSKTEHVWRLKMINTPNGHLLLDNSFFKTLRNYKEIYLQHTTLKFEKIFVTSTISPSGGCLVGSIYCTPLVKKSENQFKMHNLGQYIYNSEISMNSKDKTVDSLVFKIKSSDKFKIIGIDHLRLGKFYLYSYNLIQEKISSEHTKLIEDITFERFNSLLDFVNKCLNVDSIDDKYFFENLNKHINSNQFLEYFWFATISEYIMLYQDSLESKKYSAKGEIYNAHYKDLMYFYMTNNSSKVFNPKIDEVSKYIENNLIIDNFKKDHFAKYIKSRIIFLIRERLFENVDLSNAQESIDFDDAQINYSHFVGHILNHVVRQVDFGAYNIYEQKKADLLWKYWYEKGIEVPFNGVIPKGEIGTSSPEFPNNVEIYSCDINKKDDDYCISLGEKLDIKIDNKLVSKKLTVMRDNA